MQVTGAGVRPTRMLLERKISRISTVSPANNIRRLQGSRLWHEFLDEGGGAEDLIQHGFMLVLMEWLSLVHLNQAPTLNSFSTIILESHDTLAWLISASEYVLRRSCSKVQPHL